jgi:Tol biopolymer transport system component
VTFDGSFGGVKGIWRRDLATDAVVQVVGGDAQLPSVSEDGRYVSFTTNEGGRLSEITNGLPDPPHATNEAPNVYVRDMSKSPTEAGAFLVASAPSGSESPLTYNTNGYPVEQFGSVASGRSAISADGRYVAFVTTAVSDLTDPQTPSEPKTPAREVAIRDLLAKQTKLVSVEYDPATGKPKKNASGGDEPVATTNVGTVTYGAVYGTTQFPALTEGQALSQGASISADGSTVAWLGQEVDRQAAVLSGELGSGPNPTEYSEPLWRRIAGGSQEPTRRITGGSDPAGPGCAASGESQPSRPPTLADPCQGPFEPLSQAGLFGIRPKGGDYLPRLSADGLTVAFLASAHYLAGGEEFTATGENGDLYVVNMRDGLTRVQALRRLTEVASGNQSEPGAVAPIEDLAVSPDGTEVAFSALRTVFPLGSPAYVSAPAAKPGIQELYSVDLANDTLTRVTRGFAGEQSQLPAGAQGVTTEGPAGSPAFSSDGNTLAFSSTAANLVYGDGNNASDVFVVKRKSFAAEAGQQYISPPPQTLTPEPAWLLSATARSRRDGSLVLEVEAPGPGSLTVGAESAVRMGAARSASRGRRRAHRARGRAVTGTVVTRQVAGATRSVSAEGLVTLPITLAPAYSALAAERGGLSASVSVAFTAPGHKVLRQSIEATFLRTVHPARRSRRAPAPAGRRGARR